MLQIYKLHKPQKIIFFLIGLLCSFNGFGQNQIAKHIKDYQGRNTFFTPISLLTEDASISKKEIDQGVSNATVAKINFQQLNQIATGEIEFLELKIPYQNQEIALQLYRVNPFSDHFSVDTNKNQNIPYQKGVYYRGIIKGNPESISSFSFFEGDFNGIFSSTDLGNIVVGKIDKPNNSTDYVIYADANFLKKNDFECHVKETDLVPNTSTTQRNAATNKCVNFYFEIDYNLYQSNNNNTTTTLNWITSVFNNVQTLFANDGITVALNSSYIWTTPDIYEGIGTSSADYLYAFTENRPSINGDVGMLVGIDPGGLGGVAFLDQLCQSYNHAYADLTDISIATVPTYSWTTQVITHEFGHSLGSPHTHACFWNGNNSPIDGCGSQAGYPENGCSQIGPIPSIFTKGTIMSYCHLIPGVGISFANGFGLQPSTLMINNVNTKTCLTSDCISNCYNTVTNIQTSSITETAATVNWADLDENTSSWQISVAPLSSTSAIWTTVSQATYSISNLTPNTYYKVKIRPFCNANATTIMEQIFITSGNYCGNLAFYDTGGLNADYGNSQTFTRTITPNEANKKIKVTFSQFALEADYDFLYIYDGPNASYPELNEGNGFSGTNSPGIVTSTATDGSLTFKFLSDQNQTDLGWIATISCEDNLGIPTNDYIDFSYFPNPTTNILTLKSNTPFTAVEIINIQGRKLFTKNLEATETTIDLSQFSTGTYFLKVKFSDTEKVYKVLKL